MESEMEKVLQKGGDVARLGGGGGIIDSETKVV